MTLVGERLQGFGITPVQQQLCSLTGELARQGSTYTATGTGNEYMATIKLHGILSGSRQAAENIGVETVEHACAVDNQRLLVRVFNSIHQAFKKLDVILVQRAV